MKKLVILIALVLVGCGVKKKSSRITLPPSGITLDGLDINQADGLVKNFTDDATSSDDRTDVWFSASWVQNVRKLLDAEHADGFRIYFAKTAAGKNTIIVVSTKQDRADPGASTGYDHLDYFDHNSTYLSNLRANGMGTDIIENYNINQGATLYNPNSPCGATESCIIHRFDHKIHCADAYQYVKNFKKKPINTSSEWFPISILEDLDDELTFAASVPNVNPSGVRIYFTRNNSNRNALLLVTTQKVTQGGNSYHKDYYDCYNPGPVHFQEDNGEQCPDNCTDVTWP